MQIECEAIIVGVRAHGEHGAIVRLMTEAHGLLGGYVRGGRSRQLRPVLSPGNIVRANLRARVETVAPGTFPRTDFKARRVIDDRSLFREMHERLAQSGGDD